jgi:hypothetical protein
MGQCDTGGLTKIVFSGLSSLVIEDVTGQDSMIVVRARTAGVCRAKTCAPPLNWCFAFAKRLCGIR